MFFFYLNGHHRDLHVRTPSFPTRRSADLLLPSCVRATTRKHPMIHIIDNHLAPGSQPLLQSMFADRKRLFVDLFGWDVPVFDGQYEIDQFDNAHTIRSEVHTSELQSIMRISYAVFCLHKKNILTHS